MVKLMTLSGIALGAILMTGAVQAQEQPAEDSAAVEATEAAAPEATAESAEATPAAEPAEAAPVNETAPAKKKKKK